jgi:hypothetical protein
MPEPENVVLQPVRHGGVELVKLPGKKVVGSFHNHKMILAGESFNH